MLCSCISFSPRLEAESLLVVVIRPDFTDLVGYIADQDHNHLLIFSLECLSKTFFMMDIGIFFLSNCSTSIAPCYLIWHLSLLHDWQTEKRSKFSHCECFIYTNTLYTRTYIALRVCFTHMRLGDCTHECHVYKPCLRL